VPSDPIKHVIVLMLENQSFDRMVGLIPGVDGVNVAHLRSNPISTTGVTVTQNASTQPRMDFDPAHDYDDVIVQIKGNGTACSGFVDDFLRNHSKGNPKEVMAFYDSGTLPALEDLSMSFVICDRWFSSVPGPTWPNRFFLNTGTSLGHIDMPSIVHFDPAINFYNQPTVFERISEAGKRWLIYFEDFSQTTLMTRQLLYAANYRYMVSFEEDCKDEANFPDYVFLEPKYFWPGQNDQHPTSDIRRGDALIARVYNSIRKNEDLWNSTLFVVLYDEHGGFYDHVDPREPAFKVKAVPPDDNVTPEGFAFDLLGLRVPAVLASPWLDPGVLHEIYDHTSLLKYLTAKWGLGALGNRTPTANNFAGELVWRSTPRTDAPMTLTAVSVPEDPKPTELSEHQQALVSYSRYLESQLAAEAPAGPARQDQLAQIGERLLKTVEAVANHGTVAAERLRLYLNSHGATLPPPGLPASSTGKSLVAP
jgi:phospholipase C